LQADREYILNKLSQGEGLFVEFKTSRNNLNRDVIFRMSVKVPEFNGMTAGTTIQQVTGQVTGQVTQQVKSLLGIVIGEMARKDLMEALALKHRESFTQQYLDPALVGGLLEMTQPDSPRSPTQKYRLTEAGKLYLKNGHC